MNFNDLLFGSRSVADLPPELQAALMPPGILSAPQPDLNQYNDVTGPSTLSPDINQYRPDGSRPLEVSMSDYPASPAIGVMPGTQLGPSQEGVPGPAFGYTSNTEVYAGAPYTGAEVDLPGATGMPGTGGAQVPQGGPQTASAAPIATPTPPTPQAAPAPSQSPPALPPPVNIAARPVMSAPPAPTAPPAPVPTQAPMSDGGSDGTGNGALKGGKGILDYMYEQVGGDRLWNSKQGSKELLALGAGILSGRDFMDGLGRGAAAVAAVRANADALERDRADTAYERDFRERQLQQQLKIAEGNQAMRMALVQAQQQAKAEAGNAKTADTVATLDSGIGQVQGFLQELNSGKYKYDGLVARGSYEYNKAFDPSDPNFRLKKRLNEFATETLGELAKNFKPLSNEETRMLQSRVPNETSSVEEWKDYLTRVQTIMQRSREAAVNPKAFMDNARTGAPQQAPQKGQPEVIRLKFE